MHNLLLDTDVILDLFFDRKPHAEFSARVIGSCELDVAKGFVTPVIIANLYYLLRKTAAHNEVVRKLKRFLEIVDVLDINKAIVLEALNSDFRDFEDSLQYHSALQTGEINFIITRNVKDFKHSKIAVMTPENYLRSLH